MRKLLVVMAVVAAACSDKPQSGSKPATSFSNMDSIVTAQVSSLKNSGFELHKLVEKDGKSEQVSFVPDSIGWANELNLFRELDMINKPTYRDAYTVNDLRDANSNLKVKEVKSIRDAPVSSIKFFYLNDPGDIRRIEAVWTEENAMYKNVRRLTMEFERSIASPLLHRYRIEGSQKMTMNDSIHFVIAGEVAN